MARKVKTDSVTTSALADGETAVSSGYVVVDDNTTNKFYPDLEPEIKEAIEQKGLEEAMAFGPESFDDLDVLREHNDKQGAITKVVSDFMSLVGNIFAWPEPGTAGKVKKLAEEMIQRLPEDDEEEEEDDMPEEMKEEDSIDVDRVNGFFIWKEDDGTYRWLGVYSNKFRDDDRPAEILSEKSHIDFIERVEKGELPYPDLYVWHIKSPVGITDHLAYDDAGFSIASGTIEEEYALALAETSEDLAMSHGMPSEFIERSKEDPTVITSYVSTEVSVLPRRAAANKRTDFRILKEEPNMSIVPAEKRQQITDLLGEDLTERLEAGLAEKATAAHDAGVEFKEETAETEVVEDAGAEEAPAEESAAEEEPVTEETAEKEEVESEVDGESAAEANVEDVPETPEGDVGTEAADENYVNKEELADTLAAIFKTLTDSNAAVITAVNGIVERVNVLEGSVEESSKKSAEHEAQELAESIPEASLQAMLRKQLAEPAKSVIGTKEAALHGNNKLAKAQPTKTETDEDNPGNGGGLFWQGFNSAERS